MPCPGCGRRLLLPPGPTDLEAGCPACGASVAVTDAPPLQGTAPPTEPPASGPPAWDTAPAAAGAVPPPRASTERETGLALGVAAASLVLPLLAPVAYWLVVRAERQRPRVDGPEPPTLLWARILAVSGLVLLALLAAFGLLVAVVLS